MWPLTGSEVVFACQGICEFESLDAILIHGTSSDSRKVQPGQLFVAIRGEKHDGHNFVATVLQHENTLALVDCAWQKTSTLPNALAKRCIVVPDVTQALRQLARFMRKRFTFPVVGIGGSNGKTTTKEMLAAMLGGSFRVTKTAKSENGFLGLATTLTNPNHSFEYSPHALVLEIGIDEKGAMDQHCQIGDPDWALLTALGPEHLAGLGDWETAIEEEYHLFDYSQRTRRIWQATDPVLQQRLSAVRRDDTIVIPHQQVSANEGLKVPGCPDNDIRIRGISVLTFHSAATDDVISNVELRWYPASSMCASEPAWQTTIQVPLPGWHNASNFALAVGTALSIGRTPREILEGWKSFQPPAMRSRIATMPNGCILYDDCYNASPESMKAALNVLKRADWSTKPKIVFLGDMLDLGDESRKWHLDLLDSLRNIGNIHLCLFGIAMYDVFQELIKDKESEGRLNRKVSYLKSNEDPTRFIDEVQIPFSTAVVLVKGSRGMDLGRVVKRLEDLNR